jgi:hypothetical protein
MTADGGGAAAAAAQLGPPHPDAWQPSHGAVMIRAAPHVLQVRGRGCCRGRGRGWERAGAGAVPAGRGSAARPAAPRRAPLHARRTRPAPARRPRRQAPAPSRAAPACALAPPAPAAPTPADPVPPPPKCQVLHNPLSSTHRTVPFNDPSCPLEYETDLFKGRVLVLLRHLPSTPAAPFEGKRRTCYVAVQVRAPRRVGPAPASREDGQRQPRLLKLRQQ